MEETARPSALVLSDQIKCYLLVIAVTECRHDSKALWSKLSVLLRPSTATSISEVPCTRCDVTTDQRQLQCTTRLRVRSCRVHHLNRGCSHRLQEARSQASPVCGRQTGVHVCGLGVLLEAEMSMKQHITRIARPNCFYHLRRLRQIRRVVGEDVTSQLISAFVLFLLDYCN